MLRLSDLDFVKKKEKKEKKKKLTSTWFLYQSVAL